MAIQRVVGDTDVAIELLYCGVCHADLRAEPGEGSLGYLRTSSLGAFEPPAPR
ncbi:MAG: hypothetical protein RLZZ450_3687 [Pseudomonadota bacterium]|jgi:D-arabinose 1-dehydrogenase-like Zn-dependent alcohol dehydrogenase